MGSWPRLSLDLDHCGHQAARGMVCCGQQWAARSPGVGGLQLGPGECLPLAVSADRVSLALRLVRVNVEGEEA